MSRRASQIKARLRLVTAHERALELDVARWLARVGRLAASHIRNGWFHAAEHAAFEIRHRLETTLRARMAAVAQASARLLAEEFKTSGVQLETKGLISDMLGAAARWVRGYAAARVAQISETTRKIIRRQIDKAQADATPPKELAKLIETVTAGEIGKRRAMRIARTETGIAAEKGAVEGANATGLDLEKEWGGTEDNRIRPDHRQADTDYGPANRIPMDRPFIVGGVPMMHCKDPAAPAKQVTNCRCATLIYPRLPR